MAPSRNSTTRNVPSLERGHSESKINRKRRVYSVSETASQNGETNSVISDKHDQDSDVEDIPRRKSESTSTFVQHAQPSRGMQFDRLNPTSSLVRAVPPEHEDRGEVQRRGIDPIQPVQASDKPPSTSLSLRLDLNLDIEVDLKASIRGDLTLSLL